MCNADAFIYLLNLTGEEKYDAAGRRRRDYLNFPKNLYTPLHARNDTWRLNNRQINASLLIPVFCFVVKTKVLSSTRHRIEYIVLSILEDCPMILSANQYVYIIFGQSIHIVPFISAGDCRV